jgi:electron transport complex protein RnfG
MPAPESRDALVLHQIGPEAAVAEALGVGQEEVRAAGAPGRPEASSFRLLMTLGLAGALAGVLLVFVFLWSDPQIQAYKAMVLKEAVQEVLNGPASYETVFLLADSTLTARLPDGVDSLDGSQVIDKVYLGYNEAGQPVGFAVEGAEPGFQDIITLIFGYNPDTRQLLAMKVLDHSETPGLGDKIIKDTAFVAGFSGVQAPLQGVKPDRNTGDPTQVDMITGATISSRAVIAIINHRIEALGDLLAAYQPTGGAPAGNPAGTPTETPTPETGGPDPQPASGSGSGQEERP